MTWWMTLLVIVLVLFLIGCIPVGVDAGYSPEGYYVKLKIWLLRIALLPRPEKPTQKKKKPAKKAEKAEKTAAPEKEKKKSSFVSGGLDGIFSLVQLGCDVLRPAHELCIGHMRAADEAKLWCGIGILPNDRVLGLHTLKLRIVDDVDLCTLGDDALALLDRLRREVFDVVQTYGAVGRRRCAEVLEVGAGIVVKLGAYPLVKPLT